MQRHGLEAAGELCQAKFNDIGDLSLQRLAQSDQFGAQHRRLFRREFTDQVKTLNSAR
jgi:hypothetical protein